MPLTSPRKPSKETIHGIWEEPLATIELWLSLSLPAPPAAGMGFA